MNDVTDVLIGQRGPGHCKEDQKRKSKKRDESLTQLIGLRGATRCSTVSNHASINYPELDPGGSETYESNRDRVGSVDILFDDRIHNDS